MTATNNNKRVSLYTTIVVACLIFLMGTQSVFANHSVQNNNVPLAGPSTPLNTNNNPCVDILQGETVLPTSRYIDRTITTSPSLPYVPVYDSAVNSAIRLLGQVINAVGQEVSDVESVAAKNEYQNRISKLYLRLLCEKEYEEDHTLQHAWRAVIDDFVYGVWAFTMVGNGGNPMFVQNQLIYDQLVDDEVLITFLKEVAISNIGDIAKREIIQTFLKNRFTEKFPYDTTGSLSQMAVDQLPADVRKNFTELGGFNTLDQQAKPGNSYYSTLDLAAAELQRRRLARSEYEHEKLDWGRGFYSYEYCNYGDGSDDMAGTLGTFTDIKEDRRNCFIVTPGSLIQDQVSFVFGSALRQMELNDEYEEWIGATSYAVLGSVVSDLGLDYGFSSSQRGNSPGKYYNYVLAVRGKGGNKGIVVDPAYIQKDQTEIVSPVNLLTGRGGNQYNRKLGVKDANELFNVLLPTEFGITYIDPTQPGGKNAIDARLQARISGSILNGYTGP